MPGDDMHASVTMPLRWRWSILVGAVVATTVLLLTLLILDLEKKTWEKQSQQQFKMLTNRLADELKIPMLVYSETEVNMLIGSYMESVTTAKTIYLKWDDGHDQSFGTGKIPLSVSQHFARHESATRLNEQTLWYTTAIHYGDTHIGTLAIRFSEAAWNEMADEMKKRIGMATLVAILIASILVYLTAKRMSRPIESLARAATRVAGGDLRTRLPQRRNDEIGLAMQQFNRMIHQLEHKEKIRDVFGRYLNPELISKLFAGGTTVPESRQQDVTILFADMVNFTGFSRNSDVETVVQVLNEHFEVFHHIIDAFGGHVDKYIGDAVMAVFNHPFEDPLHTRHAATAGLAILEACKRLNISHPDGSPIQFRIGLDRGPVIVGNIGAAKRLEYTVIGNTVNVASRMAGLAKNSVVASETAIPELGSGFRKQDMGEQNIKGVDHPMHCIKLLPLSDDIKDEINKVVDAAFSKLEANIADDMDDEDFHIEE